MNRKDYYEVMQSAEEISVLISKGGGNLHDIFQVSADRQQFMKEAKNIVDLNLDRLEQDPSIGLSWDEKFVEMVANKVKATIAALRR